LNTFSDAAAQAGMCLAMVSTLWMLTSLGKIWAKCRLSGLGQGNGASSLTDIGGSSNGAGVQLIRLLSAGVELTMAQKKK
jgi:hypothetical protein